jgi:signal transduction histidine kinase
VRDEGAGSPAGRIEEAAREGRMGIRGSVRGRMGDLGGRAELTTGPGQGTEWELTLPRREGAG